MTNPVEKRLEKWDVARQLSKWELTAGVLTIVLGGIVLAWPGPSILVAATLFGVYLLMTGLAQLFVAFAVPGSGGTRVMFFISGALSLVLAILSFRHFGDAYAVLLLSLWIGISFIFQGFTAVGVAVGERGLPGRGWYIFMGIISVIAGVVVMVSPFDSIAVLTLVTGVWLVVFGVIQIVRSVQIRKEGTAARNKIASVAEHLAAS